MTVVVDADERSFTLPTAEEAELVARMEEADRGEVVPAAEMLRRLAR